MHLECYFSISKLNRLSCSLKSRWPQCVDTRLIRLRLQVIFRKKATNYRALLRKMTYENILFSAFLWLRCIDKRLTRLRLHVIFRKRATNYRASAKEPLIVGTLRWQETNSIEIMRHIYRPKSPMYTQKSPIYTQKRHVYTIRMRLED